jgi:DNA-binding NtrC family response regulator
METYAGACDRHAGGFMVGVAAGRQAEEIHEYLVDRNPAMRKVVGLARSVAGSETPVLIRGELGVGKTAVAREIHRRSTRAAGPFVHVACGALRGPDAAGTLFGPPRTGSSTLESPHGGLLAASRQGTLYLADIDQLELVVQVRLLDVLQGNEPCGPAAAGRSGAGRVIAATTCNLETAVARNDFYSGLFYYLNVARLTIPPLRFRPEDLRALGERFLVKANRARSAGDQAPPRRLTDEAWRRLLSCELPGNAAQLEGVLARAVMLADSDEIGPELIAQCEGSSPQTADGESIAVSLTGGLKQMERAIVDEVVRRCNGNKAAAARTLGLHRRTLYRLLEQP